MDPNNQQTPNPVSSIDQTPVVNPQLVQGAPAPMNSQLPTPNTQQEPHLETIANSNPNSTQNTLLIAEIRDGIVIMNDGSYRAVVMARSINFDLMSTQEREAVEFSYQGFLNSLYFDIQIFIRSQKIDMRPYLERLDKLRSEQENMLIAIMTEDYMDYIDALSQQ